MTRFDSHTRWLFFAGAAIGFIGLLLLLGRPYSTMALLTLLVFGLVITLRGARLPAGRSDRAAQGVWRQAVLRHRLALTHILAVSAVYLLVASAHAFQPRLDLSEEGLPLAVLLLLSGGLASGGALWLAAHDADFPHLPRPAQAAWKVGHIRWPLVGVGALFLLLLAEVNGDFLSVPVLQTLPMHLQFALLVTGLALIAAGLSGTGHETAPQTHSGLVGFSRSRIAALGLLTLFAFGLRTWQLETSVRFLVDELSFLEAARGALFHVDTKLVQPVDNIAAFPRLITYFQTVSIQLFGHSFTGLRITSALIGALTIPVMYLLGKTLFDRKTGWIAALLLATFPPHVHFSRLALTEPFSAFTGTLALALLARGILHRQRRDWVLGGIALGLTHYFHEGGRLLYTPLVLLWGAGLLLLYHPRVISRGALLAGLAALLTAFPVYYTLAGLQMPVTPRLVSATVGLPGDYWQTLVGVGSYGEHLHQQILKPLLMVVHVLDYSMFYRGETALLLPVIAPAFLLGLWYAIWRWRVPGALLLLLWLLATALGNGLLEISTSAARYVVAYPALMLLAAMGIRYIAPLILPERMTEKRLYWGAIGGLVLLLAAIQAGYYFGQHLPVYNWQVRQLWGNRDGQDVALRAAGLSPGTQAHLISRAPLPTTYIHGLFNFLKTDNTVKLDILRAQDLTAAYLEGLPGRVDHAFYIEPDDVEILAQLEAYFYLLPPQYSPYDDIGAEAQFAWYHAPFLPGIPPRRALPATDINLP